MAHSSNCRDPHACASVGAVAPAAVGPSRIKRQRAHAAVAAAGAPSGAALWTLRGARAGAGLPTNFTFRDARDAFSGQHDVRQLPSGNLLMIDNGVGRVGCESDDVGTCYTRAIEYRLNASAGVAEVVWQFAFPIDSDELSPGRARDGTGAMVEDIYVWDGGSARRLPNERTIVAFTDLFSTSASMVFEVDSNGTVHAEAHMPAAPSWFACGGYRILPSISIGGEGSAPPFRLRHNDTS